jgi:hypothetical protein
MLNPERKSADVTIIKIYGLIQDNDTIGPQITIGFENRIFDREM